MAGRPDSAIYEARLEQLGGLQWLVDHLGSGETFTSAARAVGCSRWWLWNWVHDDAERTRAVRRARRAAADAMAEATLEIADDLQHSESNAEVSAGRLRIEGRRWLASKFDPETFGERQAGPGVVLNVGQLHLQAVRAAAPARPSSPTALGEGVELAALPAGEDAAVETATRAPDPQTVSK